MNNIEFKILNKTKKIMLKESKELNETSISKESKESLQLNDDIDIEENYNKFNYLYPNLNDKNFNKRIAEKKEFNETKYDGRIYDVTKQAEIICNQKFELAQHQLFIKNFLSLQTPYNSLLLYHGLGSGKTCSAIGVAEEMRDYLKQLGNSNKIIVVATPNVQENFKLQLFDENKLKLDGGVWNINNCVGNKFLKEINPTNMLGLTKEKVVNQIKRLINNYYSFMGYIEFANFIIKVSDVGDNITKNKEYYIKKKLQTNFNNRLIIIDEVHNIRISDDNKDKRVSFELFKLVKNVDNLRLLFLSATPLYNSFKEIIWLTNIMNLNDRRETIQVSDVFDSDGNFKKDKNDNEVGKELLERKITGYISYVRGDNPYSFPYRIWPSQFDSYKKLDLNYYPNIQLNGKVIKQGIKYLSIYSNKLGEIQNKGYNLIINNIKKNTNIDDELGKVKESESLGYTVLQRPIEALNIVYPTSILFEDTDLGEEGQEKEARKYQKDGQKEAEKEEEKDGEKEEEKEEIISKINVEELVGKIGLKKTMKFTESFSPPSKNNFEYRNQDKYGRIFSQNEIGKYSSKIKSICESIMFSDGIVLIYSQYIDGGVVPVALALEEMGITRYGSTSSLFKKPPILNLDLKTYTNVMDSNSIPAKYTMIVGDQRLSPLTHKKEALDALTSKENINGEKIKVVLISQAGSEGIDLKNIRQIHILEPWYNMSRIEQIIGRGVRNCSHKELEFKKRNVQIFLHGTVLEDQDEEAADLYIYRFAERKSIQIGKVNRVLKENAIDCLLNYQQLNFTQENINQTVQQLLSNKKSINYSVGDKPYTPQCDYMDSCLYYCNPNKKIDDINELTYNKSFIQNNNEIIIQKIKSLMKEKFFYKKNELFSYLNTLKNYPLFQIINALNELINDKTHIIIDKYNRPGSLVNIGDYYFFQPELITNKNISLYDRNHPLQYKRDHVNIILPDTIQEIRRESENPNKKTEDQDQISDEEKTGEEKTGEEKIDEEKTGEEKTDEEKVIKKKKLKIRLEKGKIILNEMFENYNICNEKHIVLRGEDNWYMYCSLVFQKLLNDGIIRETLEKLLIDHLIEINTYNNLIDILNYLYTNELNEFENKIKNYFDSRILENKSLKGLMLHEGTNQQLVIFENSEKIWKKAKSEDKQDLAQKINKLIIKKEELNKF